MESWLPIVWPIATFGATLLTHHWLNRHFQVVALYISGHPRIAIWLYFVFFFPGILLHELSHWLMARLLQVKTRKLSIWPRPVTPQQLQLGSLEVARTDPLRGSLIGAAPLLVGTLGILLINRLWLNADALIASLAAGNLILASQNLDILLHRQDLWLWLYLLFTIGNAMLPSASDRREWHVVIIYLIVLILLLVFFGQLPGLLENAKIFSLKLAAILTDVFTITALINSTFLLSLLIIEKILKFLRGRTIAG